MSATRKDGTTTFKVGDEDRLITPIRAVILWIQGLFSSRSSGDYRWNHNPQESEIIISAANPEFTDKNNKRPFIVVNRGPASFSSMGRDQVMSRDFDGKVLTYGDVIRTNLDITCVAKEGLEAQKIAYIIFSMFPVFKRIIQQKGKIQFIDNRITMTEETSHGQMYKESSVSDWRAVRIIVPIGVNERIEVTRNFDNVLSAVSIQMNTLED